ncbi:MAG: hypothetical protein V1702_05930 [Candidatus Woesearchaeota archaeon]
MDFLSYFLTAIVSFLGLATGAFLAFISPEEMPTGRKFFPLLQRIILVAIAAIFISIFVENIYIRIILYIAAILLLSIRLKPEIIYPLLAFPFFFSSTNPNAFLAIAILVFVYGLPTGSLYAAKRKSAAAKFVLSQLTFLLVAAAFYIILKA